jgi:TPR repeat protein
MGVAAELGVNQRIKTFHASGLLALALLGEARAGPFEDAEAAYPRHDYATTLQISVRWPDQGARPRSTISAGILRWPSAPQDYAKAAAWFRKAADHGDASAQHNLGVMYAQGQGVARDYAAAVKWYRKGADQGEALAQNNLWPDVRSRPGCASRLRGGSQVVLMRPLIKGMPARRTTSA